MRTRTILTALPCALLLAAHGRAETLDVKPGVWDLTSTIHMQGDLMSADAMAKLPPQARAAVEAAMTSVRKPRTRRACLTQEKLEKGLDLEGHHHGSCHQQVVRRTRSMLEIAGTCDTSHGPMTEHAVFTASGNEAMTGHVELTNVSGAGGPANISVDVSGHWIGAACTGTEDDGD